MKLSLFLCLVVVIIVAYGREKQVNFTPPGLDDQESSTTGFNHEQENESNEERDGSDEESAEPQSLGRSRTSCRDKETDCGYWAKHGQCKKNAAFMKESCRKACKWCGQKTQNKKPSQSTACKDKETDCGYWAKHGQCKKNAAFMKESCRKACKWCGQKTQNKKPSQSTACKDKEKDCAYWAKSGQCKKGPKFMEANCKKSCKWCNKGNGNVEGKSGSCKGGIKRYPKSLPNSNFYKKICYSKKGLKIVASSKPSNAAMNRVAFLIDKVLLKVDSAVIKSMNHYKFRQAVIAKYPDELTRDIPEHSLIEDVELNGFSDLNERTRGLGATTHNPMGSSAEENILCYSDDRYLGQDITIHEFAHSLHLLGLAPTFPNFDKYLANLYKSIKRSRKNPWKGEYAMSDQREYWAEAVQSYFDANENGGKANTKQQLKKTDPKMYNFVRKYLGGNDWKFRCSK